MTDNKFSNFCNYATNKPKQKESYKSNYPVQYRVTSPNKPISPTILKATLNAIIFINPIII